MSEDEKSLRSTIRDFFTAPVSDRVVKPYHIEMKENTPMDDFLHLLYTQAVKNKKYLRSLRLHWRKIMKRAIMSEDSYALIQIQLSTIMELNSAVEKRMYEISEMG